MKELARFIIPGTWYILYLAISYIPGVYFDLFNDAAWSIVYQPATVL